MLEVATLGDHPIEGAEGFRLTEDGVIIATFFWAPPTEIVRRMHRSHENSSKAAAGEQVDLIEETYHRPVAASREEVMEALPMRLYEMGYDEDAPRVMNEVARMFA